MNFDNGISIREFIDDEEYAEHQLNCAYEKGKADAIDELVKKVCVYGTALEKEKCYAISPATMKQTIADFGEQLKDQKKAEGGNDGSKGIS